MLKSNGETGTGLEEKSVVPLGQSSIEQADARIVCAAQLPLHEYVEQGTFRADLFSRLNGVQITIPPLRKRREEIIAHFLRALTEDRSKSTKDFTPALVSPDFAEKLCIYD